MQTQLEELFKSRTLFVRKIRSYVKDLDTAEDIVQDAFVDILGKVNQFDAKKASLKTWFTKILFSRLWKHMREQRKIPPLVDLESVLESEMVIYQEEPLLEGYVRKVSNKRHKQALLGYYVLGLNDKEVSFLTGLKPENVRKVVQRFKESSS